MAAGNSIFNSFKFIFYLLSKCAQVPQRFRLNFMCSKNGECGKSLFFSFFSFIRLALVHFISLVLIPKIVAVHSPTANRNRNPAKWEYACVTSYDSQIQYFNYFVNTCDYRVVSFGRKLVRVVRTKNAHNAVPRCYAMPNHFRFWRYNETFAANNCTFHRGPHCRVWQDK